MRQYTTNAIYEYLKENRDELGNTYLFIQENNWILIYGNENIEPKLILIASQLEGETLGKLSDFEATALKVMQYLGLPIRILRFESGQFSTNVVVSNESNDTFEEIQTKNLYSKLFEPYGIPADSKAAKPVNDATSSTFHDWQRNFLSGKIKVSDVDLLRYESSFKPAVVFELKRSKIALNNWKPYSDDYPNFILLRRAFPAEVPIYITYNILSSTAPRVEDISKIRIFKLEDDKPTIIKIYNEDPAKFDFELSRIIN